MTDSPVTLITGGGSGNGAATARQLLEQGHRVTVTGRGKDRLLSFAEQVGEPAGLLTLPGAQPTTRLCDRQSYPPSRSSGGWTPLWPTPVMRPSTTSPTAIPPAGATWC